MDHSDHKNHNPAGLPDYFQGTPHNAARQGDIAPTVLMPGDPLRARFIAENHLSDVAQFSSVRNMLGLIQPTTTTLAEYTGRDGVNRLATGLRISGDKAFLVANMLPAPILVMSLSHPGRLVFGQDREP